MGRTGIGPALGAVPAFFARNWRIWVGVAISAIFVYWAVGQVRDFSSVENALARANYLYVVPALVAYFFGVWLRSVRWHFLLRPMKRIRVDRLFPVVAIGYMANDVLPARLGEVVRSYVLGEREQVSKATAFGTIFVERAFDGLAMLVFIGAVGLFVPFDSSLQSIFRVAGAFFVAVVVLFFVVASNKGRALALMRRALLVLPESARVSAERLGESFIGGLDAMQSGRLMAITFVLSLGAWLAEATMYYLVALGFQLTLGFQAYVLTTAVANLGTMIPSSPGYVGTFDALALVSLKLFGANPEAALSYVFALHIVLLGPISLLGFYYLWRLGFSLQAVTAGPRRVTSDE